MQVCYQILVNSYNYNKQDFRSNEKIVLVEAI